MNGLILDLSVVLILIIFVMFGFRNGAVKSFLSLAGAVFAALMSIYVAGKLSNFVYSSFVEPSLIKEIASVISKSAADGAEILKKLPVFILNSLPSYGITSSDLNHIMNNNTVSQAPPQIARLFAPAIISVMKSWFTIFLFLVFAFLAKILARVISRLFKASAFKKANSVLGGAFGAFKGYIALAVCMCFIRSLLPLQEMPMTLFSQDSISETMVFKKIYSNNPIYEFFKNI